MFPFTSFSHHLFTSLTITIIITVITVITITITNIPLRIPESPTPLTKKLFGLYDRDGADNGNNDHKDDDDDNVDDTERRRTGSAQCK